MKASKSLAWIAVVLSCMVGCGVAFGLAGDPGNFEFDKSADKFAVVWGDMVTYTYTVTNNNAVTIYEVEVVDDNGTPDDPSDDFLVGVIDSLEPNKSASLSVTMPLTPDLGGEAEAAKVDLIAGQNYDAGDITIYVDGEQVRVVIETQDGWYLLETHLYLSVGEECDRPARHAPGQFPYKHTDLDGATVDEYVIDLPDLKPGDVVTVAVHAVVERRTMVDGISVYQEETGWGEGEPFPRSWAMYFCFEVPAPPEKICVTNTAVVTAKTKDSQGNLVSYWTASDTATVCVYLEADLHDISGRAYLYLASLGIDDNWPLVGVSIELKRRDGSLLTTTVTDINGNFIFRSVPDDVYVARGPLMYRNISGLAFYPVTPPNQIADAVGRDVTGIDFVYSRLNGFVAYDIDFIQDAPTDEGEPEEPNAYGDDSSGDDNGDEVADDGNKGNNGNNGNKGNNGNRGRGR